MVNMTQELPTPEFPDVEEMAAMAQKTIMDANGGEMPPLASEEDQAAMKKRADAYINNALNQFDHKVHEATGDEFELFMEKVDLANKAINDMKEGDLEPEKFDEMYGSQLKQVEKKEEEYKVKKKEEKEQIKLTEEEIRQKNEERRRESGVKVCLLCNLEYTPESLQCTKCDGHLRTQKEIDEKRKGKVDDIVGDIKRRRERMERWERWKKSHPSKFGRRAKATDYQKWDRWEPSDSEEERLLRDIPPADRPEFAAMEKDAEERHKRRKEKQAVALKHKEKGNGLFRQGEFQKALEEYDEAIDLVRDNPVLYTNRAQALIKLEKFEKALADCDKCLDLCEFLEYPDSHASVVKALHHRANIKKLQGDWRDALEDFERALAGAPNNKDLVKMVNAAKLEVDKLDEEYRVAKMARDARKKERAEKEKEEKEKEAATEKVEEKEEAEAQKDGKVTVMKHAWEDKKDASKSDFDTIDELLKGLVGVKEADMGEEHSKAIWELGILMDTDDNRIYVRQKKAVPVLAKFMKKCAQVTLPVLAVVCFDAHNRRELCRVDGALESLLGLMSDEKDVTCSHLAMTLGKVLTESDDSRADLIKAGVYPIVLKQLQKDNTLIRIAAVAALGNMALDAKVKRLAKESGVEVIRPILELMKDKSIRAKEVAASALGNLSGEPSLRRIVCENDGVLTLLVALRSAIKDTKEIGSRDLLVNAMAALVNFALDESVPEKVHACKGALDDLVKLVKEDKDSIIVTRASTLIARCARHTPFAVSIREGKHIPALEAVCRSKSATDASKEQAVRALAQCLLRDEKSRTAMSKEGMLSFTSLLSLTNEHLLANSALCIANLAHVDANKVTLRPAIEPLLHVLREKRGGEGMKNSAIAMARLAGEPGNLEKIRELHGIETLYQIGNYMK